MSSILSENNWGAIASYIDAQMQQHGVVHINDGEIDDGVVAASLAQRAKYGKFNASFIMVTRSCKDKGALLTAKREFMAKVTGDCGFKEWCDDDVKKNDAEVVDMLFDYPQRQVLFITSPCESLVPKILTRINNTKEETIIVYYSGQYNTEHTPGMKAVATHERVVFIDFSRFVLFNALPNAKDLSNFQKVFPLALWEKYAASERNADMCAKILNVIACLNLELVAPKSLWKEPVVEEKRLELLNNAYAEAKRSGDSDAYVAVFTDDERRTMKDVKNKILGALKYDAPIADSVIILMLFLGSDLPVELTRGDWSTNKEGHVKIDASPSGRALSLKIVVDDHNKDAIARRVMESLRNCFENLF